MDSARHTNGRIVLAMGFLVACALVSCAVCLGFPQPAQAKASVQELRIDMPNGVKYATTTFKVDLTRDGKKDAVKVVPVFKGTRSGSRGIKVYVKGNKALTVTAPSGSARFSLYYVHMSKKLEFLAIASPRSKKDLFTPGKLVLYKYSGKTLAQVADLSQEWGVIGRPSYSAVKSATGTALTLTATFEKSPLGTRSYPLVYTYDKQTGGFELTTQSARPIVAPRRWKASVKRTLRAQAAGSKIAVAKTDETTGQTTTSYVTNKKVATMKKGAKVTGVTVHKNGYVKVKLANGKSGWFKWAKYKKGKPFKEVGAGY